MAASVMGARPIGAGRSGGPVVVREAGPAARAAYESFVSAHPAGSLFQSWAWGDFRGRQHWRPLRLLAHDARGRVLAAASVLCRRLPVGGSVLYLPRGPVLDFHDGRTLEAVAAALRRLGARHRAVFCKIDPYVTPPDRLVSRGLRRCGFVVGHRRGHFDGIQPRFNVIVPLGGGPDGVMARLHNKTRYNIRLAARRGVAVRRAGREDLGTFHRLLMETCARNRFAERQLPYFEQVWEALRPGGHIELYLAEHEGEPLAAGVLFLYGTKATYAYGASSSLRRQVMAPYALQWAMLRRAMERGAMSYDMTGVPRHLRENEPGYGLYRFKRGFWPEVSEFLGEVDLPLQPAAYRLWNVVEPAWWGGQVLLRRARRALLGGPAGGPGDEA